MLQYAGSVSFKSVVRAEGGTAKGQHSHPPSQNMRIYVGVGVGTSCLIILELSRTQFLRYVCMMFFFLSAAFISLENNSERRASIGILYKYTIVNVGEDSNTLVQRVKLKGHSSHILDLS